MKEYAIELQNPCIYEYIEDKSSQFDLTLNNRELNIMIT